MPRARITVWLAWFAALNVLWLVFISAWVVEEAILGVFAAAIAATAAEAAREQGLGGFRPRVRWLWHARSLPWRTLRESGLVLAALARQVGSRGRVRGRFRTVAVALPDDPRERAAKCALLASAGSLAPNSYVVAIDEREGVMLIHELVPRDGA